MSRYVSNAASSSVSRECSFIPSTWEQQAARTAFCTQQIGARTILSVWWSSRIRHYPDHRTMLAAEPELAAIAVCTPTFTHFEIARDALLAGKHTLLEKPPASTVAELVELQRIAAERGVVLCTSFH